MKKAGTGHGVLGTRKNSSGAKGGSKVFVKGRPSAAGPTLSVAEARAKVTPARLAAFEILMRVGQGKGHSDELLHSALTEGLSAEDRNLATALVMGVLRWQIALDDRVRGLLQRPEQRLAEPVAVVLRMGAFQLLHMDRIPAHAALSESVELCRAAGEPHAAGMVNAVLRKVAKPTSQNRDVGHPIGETVAGFAERLGHPLWMVERWVAAYGRDAALRICEADQQEHGEGEMFVEAAVAGAALPMMDDGSRLVAEIAAAAVPAGLDHVARVWDCCAAPGGKTLVMAARLPDAEALATDVSAKRLAQMQARMRRHAYAERVKCAVVDAAEEASGREQPTLRKGAKDGPPNVVSGPFDLILCDVPCSGTGTLAGNPEIRHVLKVEELQRQAERQRRILKGALARLAAGGRLVYSTCSLEAEECEQVVDAVVEEGWSWGRRCGMGRCGRCRGCMGAMDFLRWCWSGSSWLLMA
jgi:16S rRNA (cytosine967-C5)-methyltransferase